MNGANYMIPAANFGELQYRVEKLNKRAVKLGHPFIVVTHVATHLKEKAGSLRPSRVFEVSVDGVAPKLPGWTFLGTVEHTEHGNILRSVPGELIPESYRTAQRTCDHCQKIRSRKDTYVVRHQDGTVRQLGHNCIADFLGHVDPHHLARMAAFVRDLEAAGGDEEGFGGFGGGGRRVIETEHFLAMASCVIRNEGWMSATRAREMGHGETTAGTTWNHIFPTTEFMRSLKEEGRALYEPCADDTSLAQAAIEHMKSVEPRDQYEGNLKIAAMQEFVEHRGIGLLASLVTYYQRAMAREVVKAQRAQALKAPSEYFGTVGKREVFELTVMGENTFESQFGTTSLYRMQDANGNVAVWFTGTGSLEVGKTYRLKGTVKEHKRYKETLKQTVLSRCVIEQLKETA